MTRTHPRFSARPADRPPVAGPRFARPCSRGPGVEGFHPAGPWPRSPGLAGFRVCLALAALAGLLGAAACTSPPRFVRRMPLLRLLHRPWGMPYFGDPRFSFQVKKDWVGPEALDDGVRFSDPKGRGRLEIFFHKKGTPGWKEPGAYRRFMREQGSTEDAHVLDEIVISSRAASVARFTTYLYAPAFLLGTKVDVATTVLILAPSPQGNFVIRFETVRERFPGLYRVLREFLETLTLSEPGIPKTIEIVP
ncbi:MAG: hypothetical protein ABII00_16225 [Elusimicrobiota bacterium]